MNTSVLEGAIELQVQAGDTPGLRMSLPARPENVAVVRQAMTGVTEAMGIDAGVLADMKTAVSEACNNVVVHAYGGEEGPLEVATDASPEAVAVTVVDRGRGLAEPPEPEPEIHAADLEEDDEGVGLSLIAALSDEVDIQGREGEGTVVRMTFASDGAGERATAPTHVLGAVLGRVVAMLAARADFSLDRLSDAQLVSDAIAAHGPRHAVGGALRVALDTSPRELRLQVGPLEAEGGRRIVKASDLPGVGLLLEQLVDDVSVHAHDGDAGELLALRLVERG